jgi:6-phosphogluconolactonase
VDRALVNEIAAAAANKEPMVRFKGRSTLRLMQSISTIPGAFPTHLNTCGRICVHQSGRFVIVSNRGHQSIAIFRVISKGPRCGELRIVGYFHTRGETPRHFQFDSSGQYLVVANQDTDNIAVFNFNLSNGEIKYTGNEYRVPSPNFVCCCPIHEDDLPLPTVLEEMVVSSKSAVADSDLESVGSTLPTDAEEVNKASSVEEELAQARLEIDELKRQLSSLQAGN